MYDTDRRKLLSAVCHGTNFFNLSLVSISLPILILFSTDDPVVKENAREAINFHLNAWFYGLIIGAIVAVTLGFLGFLAFFGLLLIWGLTLWALFSVLGNPDTAFRYPFIFRII